MRLSEAIRLGGMIAPKAECRFYDPGTGGMCAFGAALEAIGELDKKGEIYPFSKTRLGGTLTLIFFIKKSQFFPIGDNHFSAHLLQTGTQAESEFRFKPSIV